MSRFEKNNNHKYGKNVLGSIWKPLQQSVEFKETIVMKDPVASVSTEPPFPNMDEVLGITKQEHEEKYKQSTIGSNPTIPETKSNPEVFNEKFDAEMKKRLSLKEVTKKVIKDKKFSLNFD